MARIMLPYNRCCYGNGGKVKYTYDEFDRITGLRYDDETSDRYTYEYGANGMAARVRDRPKLCVNLP